MNLQKENTNNNSNSNSNYSSNNSGNNYQNQSQNLVLSDMDKLLIIASHLGGIFFTFVPAFVAFLLRRDTPGFTLDNIKEALNWQITFIIGMIVSGIFALVLIGFIMMALLWVINIIFCLIATLKASNKELYRYPCCLRLIK